MSEIKADDFLFVDPPYDSENGNGFTSYTADKFTRENQKELLVFLEEVEKKGAKWLLTNHTTNFIKELYQGYWQFTKKAQRFINCQGDKRVGITQEIFIGNYPLTAEQQKSLEFEKWFDSIQQTNIDLTKLVNWEKIQSNLLVYEQELTLLNKLICVDKKELEKKIEDIWTTNPKSFQILPYLLAIRDFANFSWLDKENIEYWEELNLEKVKKVIFSSGLVEYLTNGQVKDLKDYVLGVEVGLGTHGRKNIGGQTTEKAIEKLLEKNQVEYQTQFAVDFAVNGKKEFDSLIKINNQQYYLETSFFNVTGSKVQEVIRSYSGTVLKKAQNNEINFLWILDGKGLKSCRELLKDTYFKNKDFMFALAGFERWLVEKNS